MAVDAVREKVQRILADQLGTVRTDAEGTCILNYESALGFVKVIDWGDGDTIVKVWSPMLREVTFTPEVYQWVALQGQGKYFAHARVIPDSEGASVGMIVWEHDLLGNYLDSDELMKAVAAVVGGANALDDDLQSRFGGRKASD